MARFMFVNTTGGATFSPEAMDEAEPDVNNMQVLGFAEGESADEAWQNFLASEYGAEMAAKWKGEDVVAYPAEKSEDIDLGEDWWE